MLTDVMVTVVGNSVVIKVISVTVMNGTLVRMVVRLLVPTSTLPVTTFEMVVVVPIAVAVVTNVIVILEKNGTETVVVISDATLSVDKNVLVDSVWTVVKELVSLDVDLTVSVVSVVTGMN